MSSRRGVSVVAVVLLALLSVASAPAAQTAATRVVVARADVHADPDETSRVVSRATYGQTLDVRGDAGGFLKVVGPAVERPTLRVEGYVSRSDVSVGAASAGEVKSDGAAVSVDVPGQSYWLVATRARVVPVVSAADSIAALGDGRAVAAALAGGTRLPADPSVEVSWVWLTPRDAVSTVVAGKRPSIMALFQHAPDMSVEEMVPELVRLVPAGDTGWSAITIARGRADAPLRADADWVVSRALEQSVVAVEMKASGLGIITIQPSAPLPAGDYAVVLRPFYGKRLAGEAVFGSGGDGLAFGTVWRITIK